MNFLLTLILSVTSLFLTSSCSNTQKRPFHTTPSTPRLTPSFKNYSNKNIKKALKILHSSYHYFHQNPEIGHKEFKTQKYILDTLKSLDNAHNFKFLNSQLAPTAVIAILDTKKPGPTIALRADMDALPGNENPANQPRSQIAGMMHSCGHDIHSAILLAAAQLFSSTVSSTTNNIQGKIVFLFQPAEEIKGGADDIVKEKLLQKLGVQKIFALHVAPKVPVGQISLSKGTFMAGSNYFTLKLSGKASHSATPELGSNLPLIAAKIIQELSNKFQNSKNTIISVSRVYNCQTPLSFDCHKGKNIIPNQLHLAGTIRTFNPNLDIQSLFNKILSPLLPKEVNYQLDIKRGSPPTHNNEELFGQVTPFIAKNFQGTTDFSQRRIMFSEDFAYFSQVIPSLYFGLGIAKGKFGHVDLHNENFTSHPEALAFGLHLLTLLAESQTKY